MAESESKLSSHAVTLEGSTDPRVKSTQFLSASFLENLLKALVRRGDQSLTPWFGPDGPRSFPNSQAQAPIPGFTFQDALGLDTTTVPGTVSLVTGADGVTPRDWYGAYEAGRLTGCTCRRTKGSVEQGPVFFDIELGNEIGVSNVPYADPSGATLYFVALHFSTIPKTVEANPRTGDFEYVEEETVMGVVMEPDSVTDIGGGQIELVFPNTGDDTLYITTDSMAGRTATAYLADGPLTTTANAIESGTITFSGGRNRLIIGDLGQGAVSTNAADYRIIVRGLPITDYLFDISGATGVLADLDSGVLTGLFNFTVPDNSVIFGLSAPTFANLLGDVLDTVSYESLPGPPTAGGRSQGFKVEVKQYPDEPNENDLQIGIRTNQSNAKYSGNISWQIDEEGIQEHVTTEEDFLYPQDDAGALVGALINQRDFRRVRRPLHNQGLTDQINSAGGHSVVVGHDSNGHWWGDSSTGGDLYFFVPLEVQNCVIDEIEVRYKAVIGGSFGEIEIGRMSGDGSYFAITTLPLPTGGPTVVTALFTAPADFTEITHTDGSAIGSEGDNSLVARIRLFNATLVSDTLVTKVEIRGRQLKNYPVAN